MNPKRSARRALQGKRRSLCIFDAVQHLLGSLEEYLADLRQAEMASAAIDQLHPELGLELTDIARDRRRREPCPAAGRGETALADAADEQFHGLEAIHRSFQILQKTCSDYANCSKNLKAISSLQPVENGRSAIWWRNASHGIRRFHPGAAARLSPNLA